MIQNVVPGVNPHRLPPITHYFANGSLLWAVNYLTVINGNIMVEAFRKLSMRHRQKLTDSFVNQ
jgi:hypothetical protein